MIDNTSTETWAYADFAERAGELLSPLVALMESGASHLPLEGPPSDHGEAADRFEAFARPCLLASLWLRSTRHVEPADAALDPERIAAWFREGMALGTDPQSEKFWGVLPSFHQFAVEMAILVMALDIGGEVLWDPLPETTKRQVADWLGQIRGHAGHHNNHLFFDLLTLEFLGTHGFGRPEDIACVDWLFAELETMYRGGGWFIDGTNENYDHYNAYAFHIYGLYWAWRYGRDNPERTERWKAWAAEFLPDYARFFSARGEPVPFGRSLTYRFNGVGVFPLAAMLGIETVDPGVMRRICRRCIGFFMENPIGQSQGCISIGWIDEFHGLAEPYSCAGSPYWAAKGLLMLLLEPDHPFFTAEERPMPSETNIPPSVIGAPGYIVRNIGTQRGASDPGMPVNAGDVELINAGGWSSFSAAARFGQWKWGRLAYRSGVGSLYPESSDIIPPDAALTASAVGGEMWFGRHKTIPVAVDTESIAASYTLSAPKSGFNVSVMTRAWWRGGAVLLVHRVRSFQPSVLRSGGFAIDGTATPMTGLSGQPAASGVANRHQASTLRSLVGWTDATLLSRDTDEPRQHLYGPGSSVPILETQIGIGECLLAEVLWCGGTADTDPAWRLTRREDQHWRLETASGDVWKISGVGSADQPGSL